MTDSSLPKTDQSTTPMPDVSAPLAEPVCCKCAAYLSIISHLTQERETFRKELSDIAKFMNAHAGMAKRVFRREAMNPITPEQARHIAKNLCFGQIAATAEEALNSLADQVETLTKERGAQKTRADVCEKLKCHAVVQRDELCAERDQLRDWQAWARRHITEMENKLINLTIAMPPPVVITDDNKRMVYTGPIKGDEGREIIRKERDELRAKLEEAKPISCSERLPEIGAQCLAYIHGWEHVEYCHEPNAWQSIRDYNLMWDLREPTHWMPLPKGPQS